MFAEMERDGVGLPIVRYSRTVLRIALNKAMRRELVYRNVATLVSPPKVEQHEVHPLTTKQARVLLRAVQDDSGALTVALATGMRQGEILGLTWDAIDLEAATLTVRYQLQRVDGAGLSRVALKTKKSRRTLNLPTVVVDALKRQRIRQKEAQLLAGSRWQATGYVFTSTTGTPLDARDVVRSFHTALQHAELPKTNFHSLRHSAASILLAMGASLHEEKETLGHSQIGVTSDFYGHMFPDARKETAERMNRAFDGIAQAPEKARKTR